jgi:hypothetical protein
VSQRQQDDSQRRPAILVIRYGFPCKTVLRPQAKTLLVHAPPKIFERATTCECHAHTVHNNLAPFKLQVLKGWARWSHTCGILIENTLPPLHVPRDEVRSFESLAKQNATVSKHPVDAHWIRSLRDDGVVVIQLTDSLFHVSPGGRWCRAYI